MGMCRSPPPPACLASPCTAAPLCPEEGWNIHAVAATGCAGAALPRRRPILRPQRSHRPPHGRPKAADALGAAGASGTSAGAAITLSRTPALYKQVEASRVFRDPIAYTHPARGGAQLLGYRSTRRGCAAQISRSAAQGGPVEAGGVRRGCPSPCRPPPSRAAQKQRLPSMWRRMSSSTDQAGVPPSPQHARRIPSTSKVWRLCCITRSILPLQSSDMAVYIT